MVTHKVFVYGSLKKGFHNDRLLVNSRFVGSATTLQRYSLWSLGAYPYAVQEAKPSDGCEIHGELYEVSVDVLQRLDRLEGTQFGYYFRISDTMKLDSGEEVLAFIYVMNPELHAKRNPRTPKVSSGVWTNDCVL